MPTRKANTMKNFRMGCAVWSFKGWLGGLFPKGTRHGDFLNTYAERFNTVEGNTTFYATPTAQVVARWASETPADFHFCPKVPRSITHDGALGHLLTELRNFCERMQGLGSRLGPCFAQLPPYYDPSRITDLSAFLQAWPFHAMPLALEVRHPAWFEPPPTKRLHHLLRQFNVARVSPDTRPIYECPDDPQALSERKKPKLPVKPHITAPFAFIRYISHPERERNITYLEQWADWIERALARGVRIYFFVHCPQEEHLSLIHI